MNKINRKAVKCKYERCKLPENNNRYWYQCVYLGLAALGFWSDITQVNAMTVFLFCLPTCMDYLYNLKEIEEPISSLLCKMLLIYNVCLLMSTAALMWGYSDQGSIFVRLPNSVFLFETIEKTFVVRLCAINVFGPYIFYKGCASQLTEDIKRNPKEVFQ